MLGSVAVLTSSTRPWRRLVPVGLGFVAMVGAMALLGERLRRLQSLDDEQVFGELWRGRRRDFLVIVGAVVGVAGVSTIAGRFFGQDVREQEEEQESLRLPVSQARSCRPASSVDVDGVQPWMTPGRRLLPHRHRVLPPASCWPRTGRCASTAWSTARSS